MSILSAWDNPPTLENILKDVTFEGTIAIKQIGNHYSETLVSGKFSLFNKDWGKIQVPEGLSSTDLFYLLDKHLTRVIPERFKNISLFFPMEMRERKFWEMYAGGKPIVLTFEIENGMMSLRLEGRK